MQALLAALLCFLFWPKVGLHQPPLLEGMSAYIFMWPITTSALALSVWRHEGKRQASVGKALGRCLFIAIAAVTVSFTASWLVDKQGLAPSTIEPRLRVYNFLILLQAGWFSYLFLRSVRTAQDARRVLEIFALGGGVIVAESIVFAYLKIPSPGGLAFDKTAGRFQSFFYSSFSTVNFFMTLAFSSMMYMSLTRRRAWLLLTAACFLPVMATYERGPICGLLCVALVAFLATRRRKLRWLLSIAVVAAALAIAFPLFSEGLGRVMGGSVRKDYFSSGQVSVRRAIWARGLDVGVVAFPWGVGPGLFSEQTDAVAIWVPPERFAGPADRLFWETYNSLVHGWYHSDLHSLYMTWIVENGLLGILTLVFVAFIFGRSLLALLRTPIPTGDEPWRTYALWVCSCAAFAGLAVDYAFDVNPFLFFMLFPLLHIGKVCQRTLRYNSDEQAMSIC